MQYVVFDTRSEWEAYEGIAYAAWIEAHPAPSNYVQQTTAWSKERQRLTDGKWIAPVCPAVSDHSSYTLEDPIDEWFLDEEA